MEIRTETGFVKNTSCSDVYLESRADYSLPDYLGDVRKILFTEASLRPSGRFAGGDEVEFSGIVVYNVIYLDSENNLSSAEFTSDYDYSVKCSGENYKDSVADTRVSNYSIRLVGPRRISARASLVGSVRLSENSSVCVSGTAFDGESTPEISTGSVSIRSSRLSSVIEREYAEQIGQLDGAIADEVSVVYSSAETSVDSVEYCSDSASVKGKLRMVAVIQNGGEPAYRLEKTVGFEESVPFEEISSEMKLLPELTVTSVKPSLNANENGCEVVLSGIVEFCVLGETNEQLELVLDGYLKSCATETVYRDFPFSQLCDVMTVRGSHNGEIEKSEIDSENLREILFLTATPKVDTVDNEGDRVSVVGEVWYSGVASEVIDDKISYVGIKFSSPFAVNVNCDCQNSEKADIIAKVTAFGAGASLDASKLYASCNLETVITVCEEKEKKILSSCNKKEGESFASVGAGITVYYPCEGDTLFSVAKRFHTSSLKVARDNDVAESVFAADNPEGKLIGIKKLLIY